MADKKLVQLEYDKFLKKDSSNNVSPIAVVNPDGSTISGGGGGSNATVTLMGALPAGDNLIGGVTIYGSLAASLGGNVTLNTSPNYIGLVTAYPGAAFPVTDNSGSLTVDWASGATVSIASMPAVSVGIGNVTLNTSPNQIGSVTISHTVNTLAQGNVTLNSSPNFIGIVSIGNVPAVSQSGTWSVGINGNVTLSPVQSLLSVASIYGEVKVTNTVPVTGTFWQSAQPVTDNAGSLTVDWLSGATVAISTMPNISIGNVTLNTGPNQIGSVTVANVVNIVAQTGANNIGLVTVSNTVPVTGAFYQATQPISGNVGILGNVTISPIQAGSNYIGLVTAYPGAAFPVTDNSGSLTVDWTSGATVAISTMPALTIGNVTLNSSPNSIGLVTVANTVPVTGSFYQSTQPVSFSNVTLSPSPNFIGLVTVGNTVPVTGSFYQATQPVSGTFWQAAQPVTDNSGSLTVDWLSGATVAITSMPNVTLGSNVTLNASNAFIGMATVVIGTEIVPSTLVNGMVSAASGALVVFPTNTVRWVTVRASNSNATTAYIGNSTATINNAMFIDPGDTIGVAINNTNALYLVGVGTTEVRFIGGN